MTAHVTHVRLEHHEPGRLGIGQSRPRLSWQVADAPAGFAPLAIGLGLTLIHLISIPLTNTSVNPARSTGPALFAEGGWALGQLWLFWAAPILGAAVAGLVWKTLGETE